MKKLLSIALMALSLSALAQQQRSIHPNCLQGSLTNTKQVTHYMVPLLKDYDHQICHNMEGTCIYENNGEPYLYNYGHGHSRLSEARCKSGYGNRSNCLHPCRTVAASMKHHRFGEILFIKELVGLACGNKRDGTEMIHDGFVVVGDTGSPRYFNAVGRFDFFWGRCVRRKNGICLEGAATISQKLGYTPFCKVWDPQNPGVNGALKDQFVQKVREEARARGDQSAADDFSL